MSIPISSTQNPPSLLSPRFTLELEFVLSLSNPHYLQYLAVTYPHLLNKPSSGTNKSTIQSQPQPPSSSTTDPTATEDDDSDASRFARYLSYLNSYWRRPEYAKYLTYPGATLHMLELLQQEDFRKDLIRPDVIGKLFEIGSADPVLEMNTIQPPEGEKETS